MANLQSLRNFVGGVVSVANPQKLAIEAGVVAALCAFSFVGGCVHKEHVYAQQQLRNVEAAAKIERQDAKEETKAADNFNKKQENAGVQTAAVKQETSGKPIVVVKWKTAKCPTPTQSSAPAQKVEEPTQDENDETDVAYLSVGALRLYDVSLAGSTGIPAGTDEKASAVSVDAGFKRVIEPNNEQCREVTNQVNALLDLIEAKQKLSKEH